MIFHTVATPVEISKKQVQSLLVSAFEGGSNYWTESMRYQFAPGTTSKDFKEGGKFTDPQDYFHPSQIIPFVEGCSIFIKEIEEAENQKEYELNIAALKRGLEIMASKYPHHWHDFVSENDDSITADVFLQCCLFGEVVYS